MNPLSREKTSVDPLMTAGKSTQNFRASITNMKQIAREKTFEDPLSESNKPAKPQM